jgi:hypothetical protein
VVGGLLGVTVSALDDRYCRGMTLAIVCVALALAGCATRIAADDVDEAAARQAADAECRRFGFERESEDYKQFMTIGKCRRTSRRKIEGLPLPMTFLSPSTTRLPFPVLCPHVHRTLEKIPMIDSNSIRAIPFEATPPSLIQNAFMHSVPLMLCGPGSSTRRADARISQRGVRSFDER